MQDTKLAYSRKQAALETSLSIRTIDSLIAKGLLKAKKCGKRVLIAGSELAKLTK